MDDETLETRFAAVRKAARAHANSQVELSVTVGGVRITEVYNIYENKDEVTTLDEQLTQIETLIADPRFAAAAIATDRLTMAEALGEVIADDIKQRQEEYRVALKAMRSIWNEQPADEGVEKSIATHASMLREDREGVIADLLLDLMDKRRDEHREAAHGSDDGDESEPGDG